MIFKVAYFDGKDSSSRDATLHCENDHKFFLEYDDQEGEKNSKKIVDLDKISWQKTTSRLVITSPSLGEYACMSVQNLADREKILKHLYITDTKKAKKTSYFRMFIIYYLVVGVFTLTWMFMDSLVFLFPQRLEARLEKSARSFHLSQKQILTNDTKDPTLKKIKDAFVKIDPALDGIEIEIAKDEESNAMALPNKKIIIYSGLIHDVDSIDELIGIIAHEMTHVKLRHTIATYIKLTLLDLVDTVILGHSLSSSGIILYFLSFSQAMEKEADQGAVKYLEQLKLSTEGISNFFKKAEKSRFFKSHFFDFVSTHPSSPDRQKFFQEHKKTYQQSDFTKADLENIKNSVPAPQKKQKD